MLLVAIYTKAERRKVLLLLSLTLNLFHPVFLLLTLIMYFFVGFNRFTS